jgi:protein SCO1/2
VGILLVLTWGLLGALATPAVGQDHSHHHAAHEGGEETTSAEFEIPDLELVNQDGRTVHFYTDLVADRVVAMNFVFTTCTTVCAPMGAIFGKLQDEIGDDLGKDIHLISISVDPVTDTPQRLKAWSERFGARGGWTLVTGPKSRIDDLLKALEVFTPDFADHSPTVLVGNDRTGVWQRTYGLAPARQLAELLAEVAATAPGGAEEEAP